jgi:hypothetical protein
VTFLEKFCECGLSFNYFEICDISLIDPIWCNGLKVINFDQIARKVCKGQISTLKSCDALRISKTKNCMDFIELKKIEELIIMAKSSRECVENAKEFNLYGKIFDSLVIIRNMIADGKFKFTRSEINDFYRVPKNFIVAIDTKESVGSFKNTMNFLATVHNSPKKLAIDTLREIVLHEVNGQLKEIEIDGQIRLNSVMLLTYPKIYEHYTNT